MLYRTIGLMGIIVAATACGGGAETASEAPPVSSSAPAEELPAQDSAPSNEPAPLGAPGEEIAGVCERAMGWQADRIGVETERGERFLRGAAPCCAGGARLASALDDKQRLVLWHKYFAFDPTKITYEENRASRAAIDEVRAYMHYSALADVNDVMVAVEMCIEDLDKPADE